MNNAFRSNCLFYVLWKLWHDHGVHGNAGSMIIRRSFLAEEFGITNRWHPAFFVPHFLHRDIDHVVTQFAPTKAQRNRDKRRGIWITLFLSWLTLWWHEGVIVGDDIPGHGRPFTSEQ